jgi:protein-tyrosine phosphatase
MPHISLSEEQPNVAEIDLHCHILPAWDDGPRTPDEALRMAAKAASVGVRKILVTPHVGRSFGDREEKPARDIAAATRELQRHIDEARIAVQLVPGAELTLSPVDLAARVATEPELSFGDKHRYALVESPIHIWPEWAAQVLFEFSLKNITPIIAHPERLEDVQKDISVMQEAVGRGALLQITARSLVGAQRKTKACCHRLLEAGLVAVVASDGHSSKHIWPADVEAELRAITGSAAAHQILVANPRSILAGERASAVAIDNRNAISGQSATARPGITAAARSIKRLWSRR